MTYVRSTALAPALGLPLNPRAAAKAEKFLSSSLSNIESIWLKGNGHFLLGGNQPSIADLSLVCDIMQLEVYLCRENEIIWKDLRFDKNLLDVGFG